MSMCSASEHDQRLVKALTPESWSHIFSLCWEPLKATARYQSQQTLFALLRVSTSLYSCSAPILYTHVSLRNFNSFFLGAIPPSQVDSLTGNTGSSRLTKNGLLHYTVTIHITSPIRQDVDWRVGWFEQSKRFTFYQKSLTRYLDYLIEPKPLLLIPEPQPLPCPATICSPALLPRLKYVQCERIDRLTTVHELEPTLPRFGEYLTRLGSPKYWCTDMASGSLAFPLTMNAYDTETRRLPANFIAHSTAQGYWHMLWGTRNIVYARDYVDVLLATSDEYSVASRDGYIEEVREDDSLWVERSVEQVLSSIRESYPISIIAEPSAAVCRLRAATTLTVYGLASSVISSDPFDHDSLPRLFGYVIDTETQEERCPGSEVSRQREESRLQLLHRAIADRLKTSPIMKPDNIVLKGSWEEEPCSCCGLGSVNTGAAAEVAK